MPPPSFPLYEILYHLIPLLIGYKSKEDKCTADLVKYSHLHQVPVHVHPAFTPPYLFPIGEVAITYTATDSSGNQASCTFYVRVIGKSSPNHVRGLQKQSACSHRCPLPRLSSWNWNLQVLFSLKPYVSCICQRVYFLPGEHFAKFRMAATSLFLLAIYSQSFKPRLNALGLYYCQSHQQSLLPFLRFPPRLMFECWTSEIHYFLSTTKYIQMFMKSLHKGLSKLIWIFLKI